MKENKHIIPLNHNIVLQLYTDCIVDPENLLEFVIKATVFFRGMIFL